jgi:hypothetical protein
MGASRRRIAQVSSVAAVGLRSAPGRPVIAPSRTGERFAGASAHVGDGDRPNGYLDLGTSGAELSRPDRGETLAHREDQDRLAR